MSYDQNSRRRTSVPYADVGEEELFDPLNLLGRAATARAADRNRPETNAKGQHRTAANGDRPSQMKEMSVPAAPVRKKQDRKSVV